MSESVPRRRFLGRTAIGGVMLAAGVPSYAAENSPGRKLIVGTVGQGGRGTELARQFQQQPGVEVACVCDVDRRRAACAARSLADLGGRAPKMVGDFRRILDDKSVDVVVVATADHWHAPAAILACAAGKHVYVEKPCCHNPAEGEMLVAAARKYRRLVQHGTQRRSWPAQIEAVQRLRSGVIGRVLFARAVHVGPRASVGRGKPAPVPDWLDYDLWQGPAPRRPYRDNVVHYNWHFFWHWGTSEIGNNGVHKIDVARWGLGVGFPRRVSSCGAKLYFDDDAETPDTHLVNYDFGDKILTFENRNWHRRGFEGTDAADIAFYGDRGSLIIGGSSYRIYDRENRPIGQGSGRGGEMDHIANLLDAIRNGTPLNAEIEIGYQSTLLSHLGSIAHRTGHTLACDPKTGRILGDPAAERLWSREYQPGWEPKLTG